jgi:hypothetical protein
MASFVPYHGKKRDRLNRLEERLRRLIARGASAEKLLAASLAIRDCRIAVLRARQNQNPESNAEMRAEFLMLQDKIDGLRALSAEAVLAEYMKNKG